MKKRFSKITVLAAATLLATSTLVSANHLAAPTNLLCPIVGDVIQANWDDVVDATKYSVNIVATYDTGITGDPTTIRALTGILAPAIARMVCRWANPI